MTITLAMSRDASELDDLIPAVALAMWERAEHSFAKSPLVAVG